MSLDPLHDQVARLALALPTAGDLALAGGGAMVAHNFVVRPTYDADLFTTEPGGVARAARLRRTKLSQCPHIVVTGSGGVLVTVDSFVRAESNRYFADAVARTGLARLHHARTPPSTDDQYVVRMNLDTLYSSGVFDLDASDVTVTLPDTAGRFMSLLPISQDHSTTGCRYGPGPHTFTRQSVGTRQATLVVRTFVIADDPADVGVVHALQDAIVVAIDEVGSFEVPDWDPDVTRARARHAHGSPRPCRGRVELRSAPRTRQTRSGTCLSRPAGGVVTRNEMRSTPAASRPRGLVGNRPTAIVQFRRPYVKASCGRATYGLRTDAVDGQTLTLAGDNRVTGRHQGPGARDVMGRAPN